MQIQASVPSSQSAAWQEAGRLWHGMGVSLGNPASAHILAMLLTSTPMWGSTPAGAHTFNCKTRAKPSSYLLLPIASLHGAAMHPTVPLLYLRVCGCGWMDRKTGD